MPITHDAHRRSFAAATLACGLGWVCLIEGGCQTGSHSLTQRMNGKGTTADPRNGPLTPQQLQSSLMAFADRFIAHIEQATDHIQEESSDPTMRMLAQSAKYYPSLSIVTSAADPDPEVALLDIITTVKLEADVWKGGWADDAFGDLGRYLIDALDKMEADIWLIAAKVLNAEQMAKVRGLIDQWRAENPDQLYVSTVRFDDFMFLRDGQSSQRSTLIKLNLVVANADEAVAQVREARLFAERALFLAGRMPLLISWQAELVAYDLALAPEVQQSLRNMESTSAAITQLSTDLHELPDRLNEQMQRSMDMLDERHEKFSALIGDVRSGITDAQQLADRVDVVAKDLKEVAVETNSAAVSLNEMMGSADRLVSRFEPTPGAATQPDAGGRPFDIREYTQALTELTVAAKELNTLVMQTDAAMQSPAWKSRVAELDSATKDRLDQLEGIGQGLLEGLDERTAQMWDRFMIRGAALIFIGCVLSVSAGLVFRRFARPR